MVKRKSLKTLKKSKKSKKLQIKYEFYNNIKKINIKKYKKLEKELKKCFTEKTILANLKTNIIINKKNNEIISFLQYDKENIIWNLCTSEKYRKKGYATKLLKKTINKLCKNDKYIYLYVKKNENYNNLLNYYKKLKFKEVKYENNKILLMYEC